MTPRIAILGDLEHTPDKPDSDPFGGGTGFWLDRWLEQQGITRTQCWSGVVLPGAWMQLAWNCPAAQEKMAATLASLRAYQPTLVICLGSSAIHLMKEGPGSAPPVTPKGKIEWPSPAFNWRGSLFWSPVLGVKCLATLHPRDVMISWEQTALIRADLARAAQESRSPELILPRVEVTVATSAEQAAGLLQVLLDAVLHGDWRPIAVDIEGGVAGITCIGWSQNPGSATVIPFCDKDGQPLWTEQEETYLWTLLQDILETPSPKVLQNATYDAFVLAWSYGIHLAGLVDDTMFKLWSWRAELPKDLGTGASLWTRIPYYKDQRTADTDQARWIYNGMDCAVTLAINQNMDAARALTPAQERDYRFRVAMVTPFLYMSLRGIAYDKEGAKKMRSDLLARASVLQAEIDQLAGVVVPSTPEEWFQKAREVLCQKKPRRKELLQVFQPMKWNGKKWVRAGARIPGPELPPETVRLANTPEGASSDPTSPVAVLMGEKEFSFPVEISTPADLVQWCLQSQAETAAEVAKLLPRLPESAPVLTTLLGLSVNINSTNAGGSCQQLLYSTWGLPPQYKWEGGQRTDKLTTDDDALLALFTQTKDPRPVKVLALRRLLTAAETLAAGVDPDGRIRCGLSVVGPKTGRTACYESPTGSGYNLQTVTKKQRKLFTADPGCSLLQFDLAGADSWTVAAWSKKLGDDAMMEDLRAGIKPHAMVVLMNEMGSQVNLLPREEIKKLVKAKVDKDGWLYQAGKKVSHMSNYLGQGRTMSESILKDSCKEIPEDLSAFSPLLVSPAECTRLQNTCYFARYWGVREWHKHWERILKDTGEFVSPSGARRMFLGKRLKAGGGVDRKTHGDAVAHEPQFNTTLATLLAIFRLWSDPANRHEHPVTGLLCLLVEPLLTVHDSLVCQCADESLTVGKIKLKGWFNNPLPIAGQEILIPADGEFGKNWGMGV